MDTQDKPLHNPTSRNRALLGHAKSKAGKFHMVPFEDVPDRISDGFEYIGINGAAAHRVIMREPDPEPEAV
jgi:hypothetical protein